MPLKNKLAVGTKIPARAQFPPPPVTFLEKVKAQEASESKVDDWFGTMGWRDHETGRPLVTADRLNALLR